ncbi:MAG: hypothetical protein JEZ03_18545 [Bacteroidales bacterium]|nr:hypothetical protein [Bacteroidales bacterium]
MIFLLAILFISYFVLVGSPLNQTISKIAIMLNSACLAFKLYNKQIIFYENVYFEEDLNDTKEIIVNFKNCIQPLKSLRWKARTATNFSYVFYQIHPSNLLINLPPPTNQLLLV